LDPEDRDEDVLLLRDPGGEDVRVAMVEGYVRVTPVTGITRCVSGGDSSGQHGGLVGDGDPQGEHAALA
jgi:hypothetical protein